MALTGGTCNICGIDLVESKCVCNFCTYYARKHNKIKCDDLLEGKYVVINEVIIKCLSGFGCFPFTIGNKISIEFVSTGETSITTRRKLINDASYATEKQKLKAYKNRESYSDKNSESYFDSVYGSRQIQF